MPLYEYQCPQCLDVSELFFKLDDVPESAPCPRCGSNAHKILSCVAIERVEPTWLDDQVRGAIQDESEPPIKDRHDLNRVVKEKNLVERG